MSESRTDKPIDVLIITAARREDDAVREVEDGAIGEWEETDGPPEYGFKVWFREFETKSGRPMRVALAKAAGMGVEKTVYAASPLVAHYNAQCLAMCGVCAGNPEHTNLGDVIIADRVYRYDVGEWVKLKTGRKRIFNADTDPYRLKTRWRELAKQYKPPSNAGWIPKRPRPMDLQAYWILLEIYEGRNPETSNKRTKCCKDYITIFPKLRRNGFFSLDGRKPILTEKGRKHIEQVLADHGGKLPVQAKWAKHVEPIGTGSSLRRDVDIWHRLRPVELHIFGLDMEGSAIGFVADIQEVPEWIVVKGVMDFADPDRKDDFRSFAARAAAEVLIGFLRENLGPREQVTPGDFLLPNILENPPAHNPGSLLNARYEVVPFFDEPREDELADLKQWCNDDTPTSVRLFVGPGGTGKTRLFIEWSKRLREENKWYAGFLPDKISDDQIEALLTTGKPTLAVIDYAESRPNLLEFLKRIAGRPSKQTAPLRIALLAREEADWWKSLVGMDADFGHLLGQHEPKRLTPVPLEGKLRQQVHDHASAAFAEILNEAVPKRDVDLEDDRYGRILYLHMAALANVEGLEADANKLVSEIVDHERHFWFRRYRDRYKEDNLEASDFLQKCCRFMAAVTLHGGLPTRQEAESLNRRVTGPKEKHIIPFFRSIYPGRKQEAQDSYLAPLEPDVLGEILVSSVLLDNNTSDSYLDQVFKSASETAVQHGFMIFSHLTRRYGSKATEWALIVLNADTPSRTRPALQASIELLGELDPFLPRPEAVDWAFKLMLATEAELSPDTHTARERARFFYDISIILSKIGRRTEALEAAEKAVEIFSELANE